jgi:hypothetical protein
MSRNYKTANHYGLTWVIHGPKERETTHGGRHFYAVGRDCDGFNLFEHDEPVGERGNAKLIGRKFERLQNNMTLAAEIKRLVEADEKLPTDCRPPWEIDEDRFRALQPAQTRIAFRGARYVY